MKYKKKRKFNNLKKKLKKFIPTRRMMIFGIIGVLIIIAAVLGVGFTKTFNKRVVVDNASMEPTYHPNDIVKVNKAAYWFSDPDRWDIVYISVGSEAKERNYIRRIVGLPGDSIEIFDGILYINDEETDVYGYIDFEGVTAGGITLEEDQYFVMGDNYNDCEDSRNLSFGFVTEDQIIGEIKD